jgi:NADH:ubiquinone oxidoreductase subunit
MVEVVVAARKPWLKICPWSTRAQKPWLKICLGQFEDRSHVYSGLLESDCLQAHIYQTCTYIDEYAHIYVIYTQNIHEIMNTRSHGSKLLRPRRAQKPHGSNLLRSHRAQKPQGSKSARNHGSGLLPSQKPCLRLRPTSVSFTVSWW